MSAVPPLVIDLNIGWEEEVPIMTEKNPDALDHKSITLESNFVVCPLRDYVLVNSWPEILSAAVDKGFSIMLHKPKNIARCYITMETLPGGAEDPYASPQAVRFCQLLAYTNVPPSVVMHILKGNVAHRYLAIGRQPGGLSLEHGIPQDTFLQRYKRFIHFIENLLESYKVSIFATGNTITVCGKAKKDEMEKPKRDEKDKVIDYAKRCILKNEDLVRKKKRNKKKRKRSKKKVSNDEALPLQTAI